MGANALKLLFFGPNREIAGLRLEILGLLCVFVAVLWQAEFNDWFEKDLRHTDAYIQDDVNKAIFSNLAMLAAEIKAESPSRKLELANQIHYSANKAYIAVLDDRKKKLSYETGQPSTFSSVRLFFASLGALLIIAGKWLVCSHKTRSATHVR